MKTLNDIKKDMSDLYDSLLLGDIDIKTASELANISGKFLKAEQLILAEKIFNNGLRNNDYQNYELSYKKGLSNDQPIPVSR